MNFNRTTQIFLGYLTVSLFLKSAMTQSRASLGFAMSITNDEELSLNDQSMEFKTPHHNNLRISKKLQARQPNSFEETDHQMSTEMIAGKAHFKVASGIVGSYITSGTSYGVAISDHYAFVADDSSGLQIINIDNPGNPTLVGNYNTPGNSYFVVISGNYAYVADGLSGLQIINIANPESPYLEGNYNTPGSSSCVAISGNYAYVADGTSGLQIINIADPSSPTLVSSMSTGTAILVTVSGNYAYMMNVGSNNLKIIKIIDPANPVLMGSYSTPGGNSYVGGIAVLGSYAYVTDGASGLQIINIANPASPTLTSSYSMPCNAHHVVVSGNYLYVADDVAGLQIINVANSASPTLVRTYNTPGNAIGVVVSNNYAYVADYAFGLQIISAFDTLQPTLLPTTQPSQPTFQPTLGPTFLPTIQSTFRPSGTPTFRPTFNPTNATSTINRKENNDLTSFYLILFLCLGGALGLAVLIYFCCRKNKSRQTAPYQELEINKIDLKSRQKPSAPLFIENEKGVKAENSTSIPIILWSDLVLDKELGQGSFGVVYKALWLKTTSVAVKKLLKALTPDLLEEFKKETEVHMHLRHPNVIMLYGICLPPPHFGMVLEFMANGSLDQVLQRPGECSWSTRLTFALEMVSGLLYLHSRNIVHRDLKSLNVLIDEHMHAKIADFGLAKIRHSTETLTVGPMGTPCWMAPELFDEGACDKTTDIYAIGIIFWEIATRRKPYEGKSLAQLIMDLMNEKREKIPTETPQKFAALIKRCWAQRAEARPMIEDVVQNMQDIKRTYG